MPKLLSAAAVSAALASLPSLSPILLQATAAASVQGTGNLRAAVVQSLCRCTGGQQVAAASVQGTEFYVAVVQPVCMSTGGKQVYMWAAVSAGKLEAAQLPHTVAWVSIHLVTLYC